MCFWNTGGWALAFRSGNSISHKGVLCYCLCPLLWPDSLLCIQGNHWWAHRGETFGPWLNGTGPTCAAWVIRAASQQGGGSEGQSHDNVWVNTAMASWCFSFQRAKQTQEVGSTWGCSCSSFAYLIPETEFDQCRTGRVSWTLCCRKQQVENIFHYYVAMFLWALHLVQVYAIHASAAVFTLFQWSTVMIVTHKEIQQYTCNGSNNDYNLANMDVNNTQFEISKKILFIRKDIHSTCCHTSRIYTW